MSWSITIARLFGSEIRIHITFLLLLAWIGIAAYGQGGASAAISSVLYVVTIFACVALHELGHALAARRFGITTPDITLLPIGGLARLSKLPEDPWQEIIIAIAGPLVNVLIVLILMVLFGQNIDPAHLDQPVNGMASFWLRIAEVNLILFLFNLIPAFPMDGGRVLRAALALRMGRRRATEWAARIGQATAFGFGFIGLVTGNAILVFVAVFVYLAATAESGQTSLLEITKGLSVEEAMITSFEALDPGASLKEAGDALLRTTQHEFPVRDGTGRLRGVLTRSGLVKALEDQGPTAPIAEFMVRDIPHVGPRDGLDTALRLLQEKDAPLVAVTGPDETLLGYVSQDNITELWMLDDAVHKARRA